jgi:toxin ParE1/3/4
MSPGSLVLSEQAEADLVDIWVYIAEDSPSMADAFIARIQEKCLLLMANPTLGRNRPELGAGICS